ncbi:NACHT and WD repeat domain-containing protein 2 [Goodea atripinnis]|uniref:NACHT and WD repeat domain-containing protein 2 n=1 Tax=Goodea atripinnis TaxID=208336 RepID=A0ABV0N7H6_9TELE
MESSSAAKTKNDKAWRNVSEEIKRIFRTAVLQLQEKGTMKSADANKFLCSALEDELDFALGKQTPAFLRKCVCYIRKISNFDRFAKLPEMARYMDIVVSADRVMRNQEAYERLLKVRDEFIPTVVAASNLRVYSSVTHCDMKLGYSQEVESHYVEGLCKQFYEDMVDIIQATVQQNFDTETDPLYDEILQHLSLCKTHAALYKYKSETLDYVQEYLMPSKGSRMSPLVVYGGPCTGKTLLLSEVAKQVRRKGKYDIPVTVSSSVISVCSRLLPSVCPISACVHLCTAKHEGAFNCSSPRKRLLA